MQHVWETNHELSNPDDIRVFICFVLFCGVMIKKALQWNFRIYLATSWGFDYFTVIGQFTLTYFSSVTCMCCHELLLQLIMTCHPGAACFFVFVFCVSHCWLCINAAPLKHIKKNRFKILFLLWRITQNFLFMFMYTASFDKSIFEIFLWIFVSPLQRPVLRFEIYPHQTYSGFDQSIKIVMCH